MGQTSVWEHLLSPPKFTLNYDVTSLHNCDFGKLLIFYNAIQAPLDIPRRSQEAKPWILSELGVGPQLGSVGTPRSGRWECAEVETKIHFSGTCSHLHLSLTYDPSQPPDPCLIHLLHQGAPNHSIHFVFYPVILACFCYVSPPSVHCCLIPFNRQILNPSDSFNVM